jgi:hypothetical protein
VAAVAVDRVVVAMKTVAVVAEVVILLNRL